MIRDMDFYISKENCSKVTAFVKYTVQQIFAKPKPAFSENFRIYTEQNKLEKGCFSLRSGFLFQIVFFLNVCYLPSKSFHNHIC